MSIIQQIKTIMRPSGLVLLFIAFLLPFTNMLVSEKATITTQQSLTFLSTFTAVIALILTLYSTLFLNTKYCKHRYTLGCSLAVITLFAFINAFTSQFAMQLALSGTALSAVAFISCVYWFEQDRAAGQLTLLSIITIIFIAVGLYCLSLGNGITSLLPALKGFFLLSAVLLYINGFAILKRLSLDQYHCQLGILIFTYLIAGNLAMLYSLPLSAKAMLYWNITSLFSLLGALYACCSNLVLVQQQVNQLTSSQNTVKDAYDKQATELESQIDKINEMMLDYKDKNDLLKEKIKTLQQSSAFDPFTGLSNRQTFCKALTDYISSRSEEDESVFSVIIIDIINLKNLNEDNGHQTADEQLLEACRFLKILTSDNLTLARNASSQFVFLQRDIKNPQQSAELALSIFNHFESLENEVPAEGLEDSNDTEPSQTVTRTLPLVNVGIATFGHCGNNTEALINNAGHALQSANASGTFELRFFTETLNETFRRIAILKQDIHHAKAQKQISILYLPIINIQKNTIIGFEALLRWNHPKLGEVSPHEFIPVAVSEKQMSTLTLWQIVEASHMVKTWRLLSEELSELYISINVTLDTLKEESLKSTIKNVILLNDSGSPEINLEISESFILTDLDNCVPILEELKKLDIEIYIDDVGMESKELDYLTTLPIDGFKIHNDITKNIAFDKSARKIFLDFFNFSKLSEIEAIAEGIEDERALTFLNKISCKYAQGFLFSKPLTSANIAAFIDYWKNLSELYSEEDD